MDQAIGVLVVYALLVVWVGLLGYGMRTRSFTPFLGFGILLLLLLNVRYFVDGMAGGISFFVGIYDVFDNLGVSSGDTPEALATCQDNACSVWGDRYDTHPSWGVAFYDRFANGPQLRTNLLYGHIGFNSIAFVLAHVQLLRPGGGAQGGRHGLIGRITFATLTISTVCAVWLATEHHSVTEYGGLLSTLGFYSMAAVVYGTAVMGVVAIRSGDRASHRRWMIRFVGSLWGSFWLFRAMLLVLGPLLRSQEAAAILICIWFSAPLGVLIAESYLRRSHSGTVDSEPTRPTVEVS